LPKSVFFFKNKYDRQLLLLMPALKVAVYFAYFIHWLLQI